MGKIGLKELLLVEHDFIRAENDCLYELKPEEKAEVAIAVDAVTRFVGMCEEVMDQKEEQREC